MPCCNRCSGVAPAGVTAKEDWPSQAVYMGELLREQKRRRAERAALDAAARAAEAEREQQRAVLAIGAGVRGQADRRSVRQQKDAMREAAAVLLEVLRVRHNQQRLSTRRHGQAIDSGSGLFQTLASFTIREAYEKLAK